MKNIEYNMLVGYIKKHIDDLIMDSDGLIVNDIWNIKRFMINPENKFHVWKELETKFNKGLEPSYIFMFTNTFTEPTKEEPCIECFYRPEHGCWIHKTSKDVLDEMYKYEGAVNI